jgi:hypothetical protein
MKYLLFAVLLFLFPNWALGQHSEPLFPLGVFDYSLDLTKIDLTPTGTGTGKHIYNELQSGLLNTFWFNGNGSDPSQVSNNLEVTVLGNEPKTVGTYGGQQGSFFVTQFTGDRTAHPHAVERRFCVATNEMNKDFVFNNKHTPSTIAASLSLFDYGRYPYVQSPELTTGILPDGSHYGAYTKARTTDLYEWYGAKTANAVPTSGVLLTVNTGTNNSGFNFVYEFINPVLDQIHSQWPTQTQYDKAVVDFIY